MPTGVFINDGTVCLIDEIFRFPQLNYFTSQTVERRLMRYKRILQTNAPPMVVAEIHSVRVEGNTMIEEDELIITVDKGKTAHKR
jgi:hypothetical protein